jgi:hypothetical protein
MNVVIDFHVKTAVERDRLNEAAKIFVAEDRKSKLPPLFMFAVYKKNPKPPAWNVKPWSKAELKHHLPVGIFDEGIVLKLGNMLRSVLGEGKIYTAVKNTYLKMRS